jgi:hypothetical protein
MITTLLWDEAVLNPLGVRRIIAIKVTVLRSWHSSNYLHPFLSDTPSIGNKYVMSVQENPNPTPIR